MIKNLQHAKPKALIEYNGTTTLSALVQRLRGHSFPNLARIAALQNEKLQYGQLVLSWRSLEKSLSLPDHTRKVGHPESFGMFHKQEEPTWPSQTSVISNIAAFFFMNHGLDRKSQLVIGKGH